MTQISNQPDLPTDAYSATDSTPETNSKGGFTVNQKKKAGITAAALLLGGVGLVLASQPVDGPMPPQPESPTDNKDRGILPAEFDAAGKVTDSMTFEQAFRTARDEVGVGGVFNWHGRWYNTFEKEEWNSLSLEQRQDYVEMLTGEKLPVKPYYTPTVSQPADQPDEVAAPEPTIIEGYLNGQRVMGLDVDHDGTIDAMVLEGADGYTYRVIDESGNDGLDTLYRYDPLDGELRQIERIDQPIVLTNDQFSQGLEASMSKEAIDSVLELDVPDATTTPADETETTVAPEDDYPPYMADASEPDGMDAHYGDLHDVNG